MRKKITQLLCLVWYHAKWHHRVGMKRGCVKKNRSFTLLYVSGFVQCKRAGVWVGGWWCWLLRYIILFILCVKRQVTSKAPGAKEDIILENSWGACIIPLVFYLISYFVSKHPVEFKEGMNVEYRPLLNFCETGNYM